MTRRFGLVLAAVAVLILGLPQLASMQEGTPGATPEAATPEAGPVAAGPGVAQPVTGAYPGPNSIQLVKVADGLNSPRVVVSAFDGTGRLFVGERDGRVRIITREGELLSEPFLDISSDVLDGHIDQGFQGMAFHPDFESNGLFYVSYTDFLSNGDLKIVQYQVSADNPNKADPASGKQVMQLDRPSTIRIGGTIRFGPDGHFYIASGDGGWAGGTDPFVAQRMDTHLGKILRVQLEASADAVSWSVPLDNPYSAAWSTGEAQSIWAYGLRNPWQFSFDPATGDMYIPDVGDSFWEEINFIPAESKGGQNFGWNMWEGQHCVNEATGACPDNGVLPVAEYSHETSGCAVVGIGVYRGTTVPFLDGMFLAGDYCFGKIWGLSRDSNGYWLFQELLDTELLLTGGGRGEDNELYVTSCECRAYDANRGVETGGAVWLVVSAGAIPEGAEVAPLG